ncbi:MAG: TetR/AcrR family transcriptional regulator [Campylobacterota bacterium]|nr:TetR/AcrR family transcriptional regulator [Campylobacterota bacterium]
MAIIVDKIQKRKDIALSCKEIIFQSGINNLTISEIAKTAGVGKGTIYDYFKNKNDIVFEIVNILILERNELHSAEIAKISDVQERVKLFYSFFYSEKDIELRELYKEFIAISLTSPDENMLTFQTECFDFHYGEFENIIKEAIEKREIIPQSLKLAKGMFVFGKGLFITSTSTNAIKDIQKEIDEHIDALFELIRIPK